MSCALLHFAPSALRGPPAALLARDARAAAREEVREIKREFTREFTREMAGDDMRDVTREVMRERRGGFAR